MFKLQKAKASKLKIYQASVSKWRKAGWMTSKPCIVSCTLILGKYKSLLLLLLLRKPMSVQKIFSAPLFIAKFETNCLSIGRQFVTNCSADECWPTIGGWLSANQMSSLVYR
uniref:Histone H1 n=1 Tax=Nilaparvata lugens TaxID=108931 RepID=A0A191UR62_NILLU|nr:histone H1 [Nilaparvata lugens]